LSSHSISISTQEQKEHLEITQKPSTEEYGATLRRCGPGTVELLRKRLSFLQEMVRDEEETSNGTERAVPGEASFNCTLYHGCPLKGLLFMSLASCNKDASTVNVVDNHTGTIMNGKVPAIHRGQTNS
jgi:hypothetical protein